MWSLAGSYVKKKINFVQEKGKNAFFECIPVRIKLGKKGHPTKK